MKEARLEVTCLTARLLENFFASLGLALIGSYGVMFHPSQWPLELDELIISYGLIVLVGPGRALRYGSIWPRTGKVKFPKGKILLFLLRKESMEAEEMTSRSALLMVTFCKSQWQDSDISVGKVHV